MYNFILYIVAMVVGLLLYHFYEEPGEVKNTDARKPSRSSVDDNSISSRTSPQRKRRLDIRFNSLFAALGLTSQVQTDDEPYETISEQFTQFEEVSAACKRAGLESSSLVIGIDFTASNEWKGRKSFTQCCLHKLTGNKINNPYQKVIWILGQSIAPFDDDNKIPAYGFGDTETKSHSVFPFLFDESPCAGFQEVLDWYNEVVRRITLSGPSNFAPIINKAIQIVKETKKYHILVIVTDGQVTEMEETVEAIVAASYHPLSIIAVGVGDGPWNTLELFDSHIPQRKFDNFHFVDYHRATSRSKSPDASFAIQALMEIPDQYKRIRELGYLGSYNTTSAEQQQGKEDVVSLPVCEGSISNLNSAARHRLSHTASL